MNKKIIGLIVAVLVMAGVVAVLFLKNPAEAPPAYSTNNPSDMSNMPSNMDMSQENNTQPTATDKVDIKDFAYSPKIITVKKGTTVTWTNQDSTRHNIAPDKETADFKASELLSKGEAYRVTFNTAGTFTYHCTPHPYMKGTVVVTE